MNIFTKIFGFIALIASGAALFFRGQMFKSRVLRGQDREKVKDKSREIQDKSSDIRRKGVRKVRSAKKQPVDYEKEDDEF